jgi:hypothetical protein
MATEPVPQPTDQPQPLAATPQITLTYTLMDMYGVELGSATAPAYLRIGLCGYGQVLPKVVGTCMIGEIASWPYDIPYTGVPGSVKLWGNDQITPSGTFYAISVLDTKKNVIQANLYQFTGTATIDLSTAIPITQPPPPPPPSALLTEFIEQLTIGGFTVTLPSMPNSALPILVWRSGIKLSSVAGDYTISQKVITFTKANFAGDVIDVLYYKQTAN